jgi:tRNA(Ile)-lysidine synthase
VGLREELLGRCAFPPDGTPVTCAVSGGADSLSLLVLATAAGCRVTVVHVDHGIRNGSEKEAEPVRAAAERYGARFRAERVTVLPGPNLQARARAARYGVLPADVFTGHTCDDLAETVILNLVRGAGRPGLAGIRRSQRRPLLGLRRTETAALCAAEGLEPLHDPTNADPKHRRTRVRGEVLPLLDDVAGRDVVPVIARVAELMGEESDLLDRLAADLDPTDPSALRDAEPALARRAVRAWLWRAMGGDHPVDLDAVERVLAVADLQSRAADIQAGWRVVRAEGRLHLDRA